MRTIIVGVERRGFRMTRAVVRAECVITLRSIRRSVRRALDVIEGTPDECLRISFRDLVRECRRACNRNDLHFLYLQEAQIGCWLEERTEASA